MKRLAPALLLALPLLPALLPLSAPAQEQAQPAGNLERVHTVRPGESLWSIAGDLSGDPALWPALYLANRDQIKHPALVYPGQRLAIPEINPATRTHLLREGAEFLK